jgi:hypothetical protein
MGQTFRRLSQDGDIIFVEYESEHAVPDDLMAEERLQRRLAAIPSLFDRLVGGHCMTIGTARPSAFATLQARVVFL